MDTLSLSLFLGSGLAWGMIHAFDPDHMAAVAGVSAGSDKADTGLWRFALRWSAGHGLAIAAIAMAVFAFGMAIPERFSFYAESSVSFMLIALGCFALWRLKFDRLGEKSAHVSQRGAVVVGIVHGIAGSAPLLALIPLSQVGHPLIALLYVLLFSAGVLLAMTSLGQVLSFSLNFASRVTQRYQNVAQIGFALFSIGVGIFLLF
ncbi:urease accessory protein UreH [Agaribacterium sp. ZY112]|uniref:urease accessory protein UreH n=1 Tax=Agaribacterium sp. ZY112 TaxID=3233574 RepID=UPI003524591B